MPDIDWAAETNAVEGEVERQLRRALKHAHHAKSVIIVLEETNDTDDGTFLSMISSEMSANEQMGILFRALCFSEYGNQNPEAYRFNPEED